MSLDSNLSYRESIDLFGKIEDTVSTWSQNSNSFLSAQQELKMDKSSNPSINLLLQQCVELDLKKMIMYLDYLNMGENLFLRKENPMLSHSLNLILKHLKNLIARKGNRVGHELLYIILSLQVFKDLFKSYAKSRYPNPYSIDISYGEYTPSGDLEDIFVNREDYQVTRMLTGIIHTMSNALTGISSSYHMKNLKFHYSLAGVLEIYNGESHMKITCLCERIHIYSSTSSSILFNVLINMFMEYRRSSVIIINDENEFNIRYNLLSAINDIEEYQIPDWNLYSRDYLICRRICKNVSNEISKYNELVRLFSSRRYSLGYLNNYMAVLEYYLRSCKPIVEYAESKHICKRLNIDDSIKSLRSGINREIILESVNKMTSSSTYTYRKYHSVGRPKVAPDGFIESLGTKDGLFEEINLMFNKSKIYK